MKRRLLRNTSSLSGALIRFAPVHTALVLVLMLLSSLSSGIGVLLILPLLAASGVSLGVERSPAGDFMLGIFEKLGLTPGLENVLMLYVGLIVAVSLIACTNTILSGTLKKSFVIELRLRVYRKLLDSGWRHLANAHMADFVRLVTGQVSAAGMAVHQVLLLCSSIILLTVYTSLAVFLSPALTVLALASSLLLFIILLPLNRRIFESGGTELDASRSVFRSVVDDLSNFKIIKSYVAEDFHYDRLKAEGEVIEQQQLRLQRFSALTRLVNAVGTAVIFAGLFYLAMQWLEVPLSHLVLLLFIFSRLMPQVSSLQSGIQRLSHFAARFQDLTDQLAKLDQHSEFRLSTSTQEPPALRQALHLVDLRYRYPQMERDVFCGLNAVIRKNETVALTGPSGVGKSTLADLIAGLVPPTGGELMLDGRVIDDTNRRAWRKRVAYVTQETLLFHASVRENLSWVSQKPVSDADLWRVLRQAAADEYVSALPDQLDTLIGDRGVRLSGGERQRLALARALLAEPALLILDEATSALDQQNADRIYRSLDELHGTLTIIVIAHNETTIRQVDQRIDLTRVQPGQSDAHDRPSAALTDESMLRAST